MYMTINLDLLNAVIETCANVCTRVCEHIKPFMTAGRVQANLEFFHQLCLLFWASLWPDSFGVFLLVLAHRLRLQVQPIFRDILPYKGYAPL